MAARQRNTRHGEDDIIIVSDHVEIHPGAHGGYAVVRDGSVYGTYPDLSYARQVARELARKRGNPPSGFIPCKAVKITRNKGRVEVRIRK